MQNLLRIVAILFVVVFFSNLVYAKPKLPKENIPTNIDSEVRDQLLLLYSHKVLVQRSGIRQLGEFGADAKPAIPYLVDMLSEETKFVTLTEGNGIKTRIIHFIAEDTAISLSKIGETAVLPLIEALKSENSNVKMYAASALGMIKDLRAVEPLIVNLDDKDERVVRFTVKALKDITNKDYSKK